MTKNVDILFLTGAGIGNVLEALYAVEYCLRLSVNVNIYIEGVPNDFLSFIKESYGDIVLTDLDDIECRHLVHSFTVENKYEVKHEFYHYIYPDKISVQYCTETELYLNLVHALYPNGEKQQTLSKLIEKDPGAKIKGPLDQLTAFYPGCNSINPVKRWPHFESLEKLIGYSKVIWIAGKQDLDYSSSYSHLKITTALFPQRFINNRTIWKVCKRLGLLKAWAHYSFKGKDNVFIQKFDWAELVYLFRRCRSFVGNDGGIMHLAAVSGAKGIAIFGPTSVEKNRPHSDKINCIKMDFPCQPCQFGAGGIYMAKGQINCPFGVKCLDQLKPEEIVERL